MAVFMINICKFNGCGTTFSGLPELIEHIEDIHIDYDPAVVEQKEASQPASIPLSYVLKFFTEASKREIHAQAASDVRRRQLSTPKTPPLRSTTPTGSEMDEDEVFSPSEDSNDSWTTVEEYSSEYILRYGVKMNANASSGALGAAALEKPFGCPVPGCKKRYKNVNGIKYHSKNGHKKDSKIKKAYKCHCGKSYRTAQGLKGHSVSQHMAGHHAFASSMGSPPRAPRMPGLVVTAAPARHHNIAEGGNRLVRIYDGIKTKDLQTFAIAKHNITSLNVVSANGQMRHGFLASNSTPGSMDKMNYDKFPKVTVQNTQPLTPGYGIDNAN